MDRNTPNLLYAGFEGDGDGQTLGQRAIGSVWEDSMSNRQRSVPAAADLERLETACRELIETRFAGKYDCGAAAVLVDDGSILTGTSPDFPKSQYNGLPRNRTVPRRFPPK